MDEIFLPPQQSPLDSAPKISTEAHVPIVRYSESAEEPEKKGATYGKIVRFIALATIVIFPIFYLPWTFSPLEFNKTLLIIVAAAIGLILWILEIIIGGTFSFRISAIEKGVVAIVLSTILATIFALAHERAFFGTNIIAGSFVSIIALSIFYIILTQSFRDNGKRINLALSISLGMAVIFGLLLLLGLPIFPGSIADQTGFQPVGSPNTLGVLAAISLAFFAPMIRKGNRFQVTGATITIAASLLILVLLNWWALWAIALAGMIGLAIFDHIAVRSMRSVDGNIIGQPFSLRNLIVPMTVVVLGSFLLLVHLQITSIQSRLPLEIAPTHKLSWSIMTNSISARPWFGFGPGSFAFAFDRFGAKQITDSRFVGLGFSSGSSAILGIATEQGVIGAIAVLLLVGSVIHIFIRRARFVFIEDVVPVDFAWEGQWAGIAAAGVAMLVAFLLSPFNTTLWFVFIVILALLAQTDARGRIFSTNVDERPLFSLLASIVFIASLVLVLAGSYFFFMRYVADIRFTNTARAEQTDGSLTEMANAIKMNKNNDRFYRIASQAALVQIRSELSKGKSGDTAKVQQLMSASVQLAQEATKVGEYDQVNWSNLGDIYSALVGLVADVEARTEDAYGHASILRPSDPSFENRIGLMWLARADVLRTSRTASPDTQKQYAEALNRAGLAFERSLKILSVYDQPIYNLGAVYDRMGKLGSAIAQLEKLVPSHRSDSQLFFELGLLYLRADKTQNAFASFQQAVAISPSYANARWYMGLMLESSKDINAALAQFREIARTNPDNTTVQQKIIQLESGATGSKTPVIQQSPLP